MLNDTDLVIPVCPNCGDLPLHNFGVLKQSAEFRLRCPCCETILSLERYYFVQLMNSGPGDEPTRVILEVAEDEDGW